MKGKEKGCKNGSFSRKSKSNPPIASLTHKEPPKNEVKFNKEEH